MSTPAAMRDAAPEQAAASSLKMNSVRRVSELIACSASTVRREIRARRLRAVKIGSVVRVSDADLAAYLASRRKR